MFNIFKYFSLFLIIKFNIHLNEQLIVYKKILP